MGDQPSTPPPETPHPLAGDAEPAAPLEPGAEIVPQADGPTVGSTAVAMEAADIPRPGEEKWEKYPDTPETEELAHTMNKAIDNRAVPRLNAELRETEARIEERKATGKPPLYRPFKRLDRRDSIRASETSADEAWATRNRTAKNGMEELSKDFPYSPHLGRNFGEPPEASYDDERAIARAELYEARAAELEEWGTILHEHPLSQAASEAISERYPGIDLTPRGLIRFEEIVDSRERHAERVSQATAHYLRAELPDISEALTMASEDEMKEWREITASLADLKRKVPRLTATLEAKLAKAESQPLFEEAAEMRATLEAIRNGQTDQWQTENGPKGASEQSAGADAGELDIRQPGQESAAEPQHKD